MIPASKNDALLKLVHASTATARAIEYNLTSVDSLVDELLMEEYEAMHRIVLSLGVVNADKLMNVLVRQLGPRFPVEVTDQHVSKYLAGFHYDSSHSKLEAITCAGQLVTPLARLIRASRILKTTADACWMLSELRRDAIVGVRGLLRVSEG